MLADGLEVPVPLWIPPILLTAIFDRITKSILNLAIGKWQGVLCVKPETAAKMMSMSGRQLARYVAEGKIEVADLGIRCQRIRVEEIERFLKERSFKQAASISSASRPSAANSTSAEAPSTCHLTGKVADNVAPNRHLEVPDQGRRVQGVGRCKRKPRRRKSGIVVGIK